MVLPIHTLQNSLQHTLSLHHSLLGNSSEHCGFLSLHVQQLLSSLVGNCFTSNPWLQLCLQLLNCLPWLTMPHLASLLTQPWHELQIKHHLQQFLYCCTHIYCCGHMKVTDHNVATNTQLIVPTHVYHSTT